MAVFLYHGAGLARVWAEDARSLFVFFVLRASFFADARMYGFYGKSRAFFGGSEVFFIKRDNTGRKSAETMPTFALVLKSSIVLRVIKK